MYRFLLYLFIWSVAGVLVTAAAGIKTGFWWFVFLGLPVTIIAIGLFIAFVVPVIGAFIGFVTPRKP
jgi:hypothetical protein